MSYCLPQLGPNPSFLDGEKLGRGQSGKLTHGGTLYLVNQNYPFKLHYSLSSNGSASSAPPKGLKATDKTKGGRNGKETEARSSPNPKRSIMDFFSTSPMKVPHFVWSLCWLVLFHVSYLLMLYFFTTKILFIKRSWHQTTKLERRCIFVILLFSHLKDDWAQRGGTVMKSAKKEMKRLPIDRERKKWRRRMRKRDWQRKSSSSCRSWQRSLWQRGAPSLHRRHFLQRAV